MLGCWMVYFFLQTHRNWVWAYFESLMLLPKPAAELATVAGQSIAAVTTIAITGITAVSAIVLFFITGNVAALGQMFKFSSIGQAIGQVTASAESSVETERMFNCDQLDPKDVDQDSIE